MSTTTPNLALTLYDSTTDQVVTFATFRAVWGGTATTSNFYKIDTWAGTVNSSITTLQNQRGAIPVSALFISSNYYEATVSSITSYSTGMSIILSVDTTSSGTVTLNINSLGTKSLMKVDSTGTPINLTGSDLVDGRQYLFTYDGTRWLWVSANSADQIQIVGSVGNVVTVGSTNNLDGSTTPSSLISSTVHAATEKTSLADIDEVGITDSAASYVLKRITWSNFKTAIGTGLGSIINALTGKTTPVGADVLSIADSADSYATKKVLLSNLYKSLGTGTQDATTFLRGDGTYAQSGGGKYNGLLNNGQISVSVASNNITVALKTMAGSDASVSDPIKIFINGTERSITGALSVTKNAGTNWFNSGSTELTTKEIDYFVYLGYNATDGVTIGFARIPYANTYGDFSTTSTNEKYCAISTITNATSTDTYVNIGRFAATLSGTNWSVPTYTGINLIQKPILYTRQLDFTPSISYLGGTTNPTSNTVSLSTYRMDGTILTLGIQSTLVRGAGNRTITVFSMPWSSFPQTLSGGTAVDNITASGTKNAVASYQFISGGVSSFYVHETMANDGIYYVSLVSQMT